MGAKIGSLRKFGEIKIKLFGGLVKARSLKGGEKLTKSKFKNCLSN